MSAASLGPEPVTGEVSWGAMTGLVIALAGLAVLPAFAPIYYVELATTALVAAMLALSLQVLVGCTGLVSLGHGAFYGLAAYTVYLVSKDTGLPIWLTLPLAIAVSALAALVVGAISLRTRGFFFLMVTLAFGQMIFFVFHDTKIGGGADGAYFTRPVITAFGWTLDLPRRQRPIGVFYVALVQTTVMFVIVTWLMRTLFGRVLTGIRINEHRMTALGYNTYAYKLAAFVVAGALAGAAGHMFALQRGLVNPELVGWHRSIDWKIPSGTAFASSTTYSKSWLGPCTCQPSAFSGLLALNPMHRLTNCWPSTSFG